MNAFAILRSEVVQTNAAKCVATPGLVSLVVNPAHNRHAIYLYAAATYTSGSPPVLVFQTNVYLGAQPVCVLPETIATGTPNTSYLQVHPQGGADLPETVSFIPAPRISASEPAQIYLQPFVLDGSIDTVTVDLTTCTNATAFRFWFGIKSETTQNAN